MATFNYTDIRANYNGFIRPVIVVKMGGKDFSSNKYHFVISDVEIENTSDFEASIATFMIYNSFNKQASRFEFKELKDYIVLGTPVVIYMGYEKSAREVFRGFIAKVNFEAPRLSAPGIRITVMDVKGLMMSGSYSKQLLADNYGDAVDEILKKTNYEKIKKEGASSGGGMGDATSDDTSDSTSIITKITIDPTPDKKDGAGGQSQASGDKKVTDITIEMVNESDYEFVVKAAKKLNYEFFSIGGHVYFRKAKSDTDILIVLGPETGMRSMDVQYDITGLAGSVEVRGIDVGKGDLISAKKKLNNKISQGSKAKGLVSEIEHVVIDPTIHSKEEAESRADFLSENIAYRLGTLHAEFSGMPELRPGKFIILQGLGMDLDVKFYITSVIHKMNTEDSYITKIIAKACSIEKTSE